MLKLTVLKDVLNESIQHVSKAVSSRTTIPILSGIKMDATADGLTLTASDTEIAIQSHIPLEKDEGTLIELEQPGSIVVPGKLFIEMIRKLPTDKVEIQVSDFFHITIRSGSSELEMIGLDPEEYPLLPRLEENNRFSVSSEILKSMIKQTIFSVSTNESTPVLTGVLWNLENRQFKFVSTDRHRLSTSEYRIDTDPSYTLKNIVISGKNLTELQKLLPDENTMIDIVAADNQVMFNIGPILFFTRILDGTYPDTSRIIPQTFKSEIVVNTKAFTDAMERAYLLSREEKTNIVKLATAGNNKIEISSSLSELGKITELIEPLQMTGEEIKISFNSRYMLDALKVIESENVHIGFTGAMSPFVIRPHEQSHQLHLVLPYRTAN